MIVTIHALGLVLFAFFATIGIAFLVFLAIIAPPIIAGNIAGRRRRNQKRRETLRKMRKI